MSNRRSTREYPQEGHSLSGPTALDHNTHDGANVAKGTPVLSVLAVACAPQWPAKGRRVAGVRALSSAEAPGRAPFVRIQHRRTKLALAAAPRRASHLIPRPLPKLANTRFGIVVSGLKHVRCGPALQRGSSLGASFGFWHLSAREDRRRLGRFQHRERLQGAKSTRRTIKPSDQVRSA
jgi:hypothetical protein